MFKLQTKPSTPLLLDSGKNITERKHNREEEVLTEEPVGFRGGRGMMDHI